VLAGGEEYGKRMELIFKKKEKIFNLEKKTT
jgi:hypothetical protein